MSQGPALPAPEPDALFSTRFFRGPQLYFWLQKASSPSHCSQYPCPHLLPLAGHVPMPTSPMGSQVCQPNPALGRLAG